MLKLELRNKNFLIYNLSGFLESELLAIYYTVLFLIKDYSQLPNIAGFYHYLIGTREEPTFIKLELQKEDQEDEFLIDEGVDINGTRTHKIVMQNGIQSQSLLEPNIRLIFYDFYLRRIFINGEELESIEECYTNYSSDVGLLNFINTTLRPYFPKYKLISYNLILPNDADHFVTWPLETTELEYQISVKLLRDCYISRYVFSNKYDQYIIVVWRNIIPDDFFNIRFSIFNTLFDEIQKLGVYLIYEEEADDEFNKHDTNLYW